mmetsp:Transcript_4402/g.12707  ORF Transcript_4402/g.12707 Transcript_4402/m.12707 type:complete len:411 (+) Transcript_4402:305-1537(+)
MILPLDHWEKERYPMKNENDQLADGAKQREMPVHHPGSSIDSIPLEQAKAFVKEHGFRVMDQLQGDLQLYLETLTDQEDQGGVDNRIFGMDCEMVKTSVGSELARLTLVQYDSFHDGKLTTTTIMDELVKPYNPVLDYLTRHSGITATMLEPVQTRLEQVQVYLLSFLRPGDILVGHSLENDLMATHFLHPRVIDTSLVFRHTNQRTKFSLRHLSTCLLKKTIQTGSHCSEEDAQVTLELAVRRAWLGDTFALPNASDRKSIFPKWSKRKIVGIGPAEWLQAHITNHANGIHALSYDSVEKCKKPVLAWCKGQRKAQMLCCHLNVLDETEMHSLEQSMSDILKQVPLSSMLMIALQEGLGKAREIFKTRRVCQDPRSSVGWTEEDEDRWKMALERCRQGHVLWIGSAKQT